MPESERIIAGVLALVIGWPAAATECVGHRGNNGEELENSFTALESAYAIGVPNIEFDIRHTQDGIALLSHDENLRRVAADKPGRECALRDAIEELTAQDIALNCEMKNGDEVAFLGDVFERFEDRPVRILLEFKDIPNERTLNLIREYYGGRTDSIRLISKDVDALTEARDGLGQEYAYLHIHRRFNSLNRDFDGILQRSAKAQQLAEVTTDSFATGTYTINKAEEMIRYRDAGLSYVISDYPRLCMRTLAPN